MEFKNKKCSFQNHAESNAISYCGECKIFMCNKCENHHSNLFLNHITFNLQNNNEEIFTGYCLEENHKNKFEFFCKDHNQLCCAACISKIKKDKIGNHKDCNVCLIEDIKSEKKNNLDKNIQILEELSKNIDESIKTFKTISEKIIENKEQLKLKVQKIFTNIRNELNNREDELLLQIDKQYETLFFNEEIIKESEKLPFKIKNNLEKCKVINKEFDENKLVLFINECIKIEKIINQINIINENIKKSKKSANKEIILNIDEREIKGFMENIKKFGKIQRKKEYINFREINKEVNIIEHSKFPRGNELDIMIGKKNGNYSLFKTQNDNHYAIFDLNKKLYLKEILISVKQSFGCVLKNFKVSIKDEEGNWEEINSFCCQDNNCQIDMQKFPIGKETQFVKINFIDAYSKDGGDYILIRRLSFNVGDID